MLFIVKQETLSTLVGTGWHHETDSRVNYITCEVSAKPR